MEPFAYLLAAIWGVSWALLLQLTTFGRFLARRRTWLTVVVGVGGDLLILLLLLDMQGWLKVATVITLSSLGVIGRSLYNELREDLEALAASRAGR